MTPSIAIIGAGLAGLTAARRLREAGLSPVLYDKGRRPGGRLATRRTRSDLQFDHGAQYLSAKTPGFAAVLEAFVQSGAAGRWRLDDGREGIVGLPGMSGLARSLAEGVSVRQGVEVTCIEGNGRGWIVAGERFDRVICTVPAPQAVHMLAARRVVADALRTVVMEPVLALMLAHSAKNGRSFTSLRAADDPIAWLALDSAKPSRVAPDCWVAQASVDWSRAHVDLDRDEIANRMLPLVCHRLGLPKEKVTHAAAHRWRYAHASTPLGQPFLSDGDTLFVGGDWALSARAEGAWVSGTAMADAVLQTV